MNEYQEHPGPNLAGLVFVAATLTLAPPLYAYLLALAQIPPPERAHLPALPIAAVIAVLAGGSYLSPRLRAAPWPLRLVPPILAALSLLLPVGIPIVPLSAGLRVHRLYLTTSTWKPLLTIALQATAAAAVAGFIPAALLRGRHASGVAPLAHGTARWATQAEIRRAGLLGAADSGVHLGYLDRHHRHPLTDASDHHVLVFAPPGIGKTTALVIPTLLQYRTASAWVLDPKGELYDATAAWRQSTLHHRCIRYAPTEPSTPAWNPLLEIPRGKGDIATATGLARNLVVAPPAEGAQHWILAARSLWTALALHVRYAPDLTPTMATLRAVLSSHPNHDDLFDEISSYPHDPEGRFAWRDPVYGEPSTTHPEVALLGRKFRATPGRERGSIISTLAQYLDPWGDPQIAAATHASDFSLSEILGTSRTTLYLSIPFHDLGRLAPLIRLQLAALARRLTERPTESPDRLELILDEFASLGRVPIMEDLLAFLRGYGARAFLLLQDLAQVRRLYGDRESITANCRVHVSTATQSPGTRKHTSTLAGTTTVRYRRTSHTRGGPAKHAGSRTTSMVEASRPLVTEGEVGTLDLGTAIVFKAGLPPVRAYLRPYFDDPTLRARSRHPIDPPPHQSPP